jgi:cold shock CspA family protein
VEELFDFSCEFKVETANAFLVNDGDADVWIPKSQITAQSCDFKKGANVDLEIPQWLAEEKGIC